MPIQLQSLDATTSDNWKSKYPQVLNELEDQGRVSSCEESALFELKIRTTHSVI
jgi:hypothetical protein